MAAINGVTEKISNNILSSNYAKDKQNENNITHEISKTNGVKAEKENSPIEKPKFKELDGYVGFANLPNQVYRKAVKKGFEFTLMVVGKYNCNSL